MPLALADKNRTYTIVRITGKDEVRAHLNNLGFIENEPVRIKQAINGNLIVEVKGTNIALSDKLARRIQLV